MIIVGQAANANQERTCTYDCYLYCSNYFTTQPSGAEIILKQVQHMIRHAWEDVY